MRTRKPDGYYANFDNRRNFLIDLGIERGNKLPEDWYTVSQKEIRQHGGGGSFLKYYAHAHAWAVVECFPEHNFVPWKFTSTPDNLWRDHASVIWYLEWLSSLLNINELDDWYSITIENFRSNHGRGLLFNFGDSPYAILRHAYPDHNWLPWLFGRVPKGFWSETNLRWYFGWLGQKLQFIKPEHWYNLTKETLRSNHGAGLLSDYFNGSVLNILKFLFPEHKLLPWKLQRVPKYFWTKQENLLWFLEWISTELEIVILDDWYNITREKFQELSGGLLREFDGSFYTLLKSAYPDHFWLPWKFAASPHNFWKEKENIVWYLSWLTTKVGIATMEDWYSVYRNVFRENHGEGLLAGRFGGSIYRLLRYAYPDFQWQPENFGKNFANQRLFYRFVKASYPDAVYNYKHYDMRFSGSGMPMESDIWIPSIGVSIEIQGLQHYKPIPHWGGKAAFSGVKKRDKEKRIAAKKNSKIRAWLEVKHDEWDCTPIFVQSLLAEYSHPNIEGTH